MAVRIKPSLPASWRVLRWVARLWSILPIWFMLAELFYPHSDPNVAVPWTDWLLVAAMALSALVLAWAWWRPWQGGWASLALLLLFLLGYWILSGEFFPWQGLLWLVNIAGPALLFILLGRQERAGLAG